MRAGSLAGSEALSKIDSEAVFGARTGFGSGTVTEAGLGIDFKTGSGTSSRAIS